MIKVDIVNEVSRLARHHQGEGRGGRRCRVRRDAAVHAARRTHRAARLRRVPGEAPQARHRPQSADRQGGPHPAGPDHPLQARQRTPEHRRHEPLHLADLSSSPPVPAPACRTIRRSWCTCTRRLSLRRASAPPHSCSRDAGLRRWRTSWCTASGSACRSWRFLAAHEFGHYCVVPAVRRRRLAALLPAGAAPLTGHARRLHPHPRGASRTKRVAVRHRRRRADRRLRRRWCRSRHAA